MKQIYWLVLTVFIWPVFAQNASKTTEQHQLLKDKISQAIIKFEQTNNDHWSYQVARYENEEGTVTSSIELFTPNSDIAKQWTLLQINGDAPTDKQKTAFRDKKFNHAKSKQDGNSFAVPLREIINLDSLKLAAENTSQIDMSFDVVLSKLGDDAIGKLQGYLTYNKQLQFIESIEIKNNAEFSPMFSANITELTLTFRFSKINDDVLPRHQEMTMQGTFAFFTEINEISTDSYSNYRQQIPNH